MSRAREVDRVNSRSSAAVCAAATTSRQTAPPNNNYQTEAGVYDCVVVGGGISGLVTAQAFVSDHAQTVKK